MKIAFVNILYSKKDERGGLGAHIEDLSLELSRSRHDVTVITSGAEKPYNNRGVRVVPLGKVERYSRPSQFWKPIYLVQRLVYMLRVTRYVRNSNFDLVEAAEGGFEHLLLVLVRTCPIVTKLHGNFRYIYAQRNYLAGLVERLEAFVVKRSDAIYTSSLVYAKSISKAYRIPLERIKIIPCGINVAELSDLEEPDFALQYPITENQKVIFLAVGSSPARKGAHLFLKAARKFPERNVLFVLSCSHTEFLEGIYKPTNLLILPNLERTEFYNWIKRADVMVFPSQFESFAIAVREAMLLKKPIIVSSHIPLEDIEAEYPQCFVLAKNDADHLVGAILEMTNGKQSYGEVTADYLQGLRDKYDMRRVAEATLDLYKEAGANFRTTQEGEIVLR